MPSILTFGQFYGMIAYSDNILAFGRKVIMMRVSLLILLVVSFLFAISAAQAEIRVLIVVGAPAPCYGPPVMFAPAPVWQNCQPQFNPGYNPGYNYGYGNPCAQAYNQAYEDRLRSLENQARSRALNDARRAGQNDAERRWYGR